MRDLTARGVKEESADADARGVTQGPLPPIDPRLQAPADPRAKLCLARALEALELFTDAPLRLRDYASAPGVEFFDLQEEFEVGPRGQRFIVAVDHDSGAVMVPVGSRLEATP